MGSHDARCSHCFQKEKVKRSYKKLMHILWLHVKFSSRTYIHRAYKLSPSWWLNCAKLLCITFLHFFLLKIMDMVQLSFALSIGDPCEGDLWSYRQTELMLVRKTLNNPKESLHSACVLCSVKGHLTFFSVPLASAKMPLSAQMAAGNLPWLSWWPRGSDWLPRESSTFHTGHKYPCPSTLTGTGKRRCSSQKGAL